MICPTCRVAMRQLPIAIMTNPVTIEWRCSTCGLVLDEREGRVTLCREGNPPLPEPRYIAEHKVEDDGS